MLNPLQLDSTMAARWKQELPSLEEDYSLQQDASFVEQMQSNLKSSAKQEFVEIKKDDKNNENSQLQDMNSESTEQATMSAAELRPSIKTKTEKSIAENKEASDETKDIEQLLLAVSDQTLFLQQLQQNPAAYTELMKMLQQLMNQYGGNIQLGQLSEQQQQQLIGFLEGTNGGRMLFNDSNTLEQLLNQLSSSPVTSSDLQIEQVNLLAEAAVTEIKADESNKENATVSENEHEVSLSFSDLFTAQQSSKSDAVNGVASSSADTALFSDLRDKIQTKVEEIQKFVFKNERILLQMNGEQFGDVEVYLKKQHDSIKVHVEISKEENKQQLNAIFEEIKAKLKEQDIQVEITYTEREQKDEQRNQTYQTQQDGEVETKEEQFEALLEGIGYE